MVMYLASSLVSKMEFSKVMHLELMMDSNLGYHLVQLKALSMVMHLELMMDSNLGYHLVF